uniref:Rad50/SbcC-type AAA domain-containing protein n=1 Tax=Pediculus humanus subsp. corporis TaxID=121224 RepID=A0A1S4N1W6_PEDHC
MGENKENEWNQNMNNSNILEVLAGKIECLQITNFMCHSNLEIKFNSMINFITGRNGSGKSAIMTALIVVLGGTATITGRGSGLSDFIKKGENWAKISITLLNEGHNSYKKEYYGSKIIISRNISKTGSNSYVCKSENGVIVSKKKEEVDKIILAFNWQIKNPVCILNQDVARSFLCTSDDEMRFTMFSKATQLDYLKILYVKTMELLTVTKKQLQIKEKGVEKASQEVQSLKEKLALFVSLEKRVHELRDLENEYLWSLVAQEEQKLVKFNIEKKNLHKKKEEILQVEISFEKTLGDLKLEMENIEKKVKELKILEKENKNVKHSITNQVFELENEIQKNETQLNHFLGKEERNQSDINGIKEHLMKCETSSSQDEEGKKQISNKISKLKENLTELREKMKNIEIEMNSAQDAKMQNSKILEGLNLEVEELQQNKVRLETLIRNSKLKNRNNYHKYGPFTQDLLTAIEDAWKKNLFIKKPVGPCGVHVTFSGDPKWGKAVESILGSLMTSYCCDGQKDFQVLSDIMNKVCGNKQHPPVIISKFLSSRHNVSSKRVILENHPSILDVLTFDNDVVFNTFIDQARIETIVLFETDEEAAALMSRIENVPKNLFMGLTISCDQYFPAPNYRTYYGNSKRMVMFFENISSNEDALQKIEMESLTVNKSLERKKLEIIEAKNLNAKANDTLKSFQEKMKEFKHVERKIQVEINQLSDFQDTRPVTITKVALEEEVCLQLYKIVIGRFRRK